MLHPLLIVATLPWVASPATLPPGDVGPRSDARAFVIAALPDTQYYCETAAWTRHFNAQTQWIRDWRSRFGVAFVTHLGDIVQNGANGGNEVEWVRADAAIDVLDALLPAGGFPYAVCLGNHDFESVSAKDSGSATYDRFFGPSRYAGRPWYLGHSADRRNHAQAFEAGGRRHLHLTLEWRPDDEALRWAQGVVDANPGVPTIVSTHEHVRDPDRSGLNAGRSSAGNATWFNFVRVNPQVFMVLNGHFGSGVPGHNGEHYVTGVNDAGGQVVEMLSDFQAWAEGGSGYLRLIRIDERNNQLVVRTFSPSLNQYQTDFNSQMRFSLDFAHRFDGATRATSTLTFRDGFAGYAGTHDAQLNSASPSTAAGTGSRIAVASVDGATSQGLIRFDGLFGAGLGQIPADRDVLLAKLRLAIANTGSGLSLHEALADWNELSTWNSLTGGLAPDGLDLMASPVAVAGAAVDGNLLPLGFIELDVTSSLRAIMNGGPDKGWALLPFATPNGIEFTASESGEFLNRPQLVVTIPESPVEIASFQQGVGGYAGTQDTELRQSAPDAILGSATSVGVDAGVPGATPSPRQGLLRFDGLFGEEPGRIPPGSRVTSAMLTLNVQEAGSGFTLHRVLAPWSEVSTWNSLAAGIVATDVEAHRWTEHVAGTPSDGPWVRNGTLRIDVTDSVQAWEQGEPNHGWALLPRSGGIDDLLLSSSESLVTSARPRLVVRFLPPARACVGDFNGDGGIDGSDVGAFFVAWEAADPAADLSADGGIDIEDVIAFIRVWEIGC